MTSVKSNLCPTCGGVLRIDLDKQIYLCPFCGISYDYEYFREDNVKDVASRSIARSEYGAAKDAYDFILAKDPHDFDALRGLFLCENKWKNMQTMLRDNEVHAKSDEPSLINAVENCLPGDKAYFEKIREALDELSHYRDLKRECKDLDRKKDSAVDALNQIKDEYYINSRKFMAVIDEFSEMDKTYRDAILVVAITIPLLIFTVAITSEAWWFLILIAALIAAAIVAYNVKKSVTAKHLLASMKPAGNKIKELTDLYNEKCNEAEQSHRNYGTLVQEILKMDPAPSEPADQS